jgi:hypothetical protein
VRAVSLLIQLASSASLSDVEIRRIPVGRRFSGHFLKAILKREKLLSKPLSAR